MKTTIALIALTFAISSTIFASDFGTISKEVQNQWEEARIHDLVAQSSDDRSSISKRRSIAGQSTQEIKWANDFETLMNSNDNKDYLGLALKL